MATLWSLDLSPGASTWLVGFPTSNGFYEIPPDTADPSYPEVISMEAVKYAATGGPHGEPCLEPDAPYASGDIVDAITFGAWAPALFGPLAGGKWDMTRGRHVIRFWIDSDVIAAAAFLHVFTVYSLGLFGSNTAFDVAFYDDAGCVFELSIQGMSDTLSATIPWASLQDKWIEVQTEWTGFSTASCSINVAVRTSTDGDSWTSLGVVVSRSGAGSVADDMDGSTPLGYAAAIGLAGIPGKHIYFAELEDGMASSPPLLENNASTCCSGPGVEGSGVAKPGAGVEKKAIPDPTWIPRMTGGGQVPQEPDLTDPEDWSDA